MRLHKTMLSWLYLPFCLLLIQPAWAQNAIEAVGVSQHGGDIVLKLTTSQPMASVPASFSVATKATPTAPPIARRPSAAMPNVGAMAKASAPNVATSAPPASTRRGP